MAFFVTCILRFSLGPSCEDCSVCGSADNDSGDVYMVIFVINAEITCLIVHMPPNHMSLTI